MQPTYEARSKTKLIVTVVTVLVVAGLVLIVDHLKAEDKAETARIPLTTTQPVTSTNNAATSSTSPNPTYKDGTYTASSHYYVPHGSEDIRLSVTIKNGVIANSSVTNSETNRDSADYQQGFASVYKNYVVGKNINGLQLGTVAGASDTTQGFNDALNQIAAKAHA
jgi:uncharacterized protein with FMN-binding domain